MDTSVLVSALRSSRGASHRLLMLVGGEHFELNLSVPLVLEYEDAALRLTELGFITAEDVEAIIDYLCAVANHRQVFYLWRPFLPDPNDDMILELAVAASCDFIVTHNTRDFAGAEQFGQQVLTPQQFLREIGDLL
jgi:predicted nucleic acid-binding protein